VVFRQEGDLRRLFARLVHYAMTTFRSPDVLRFLGKRPTSSGQVDGKVKAEVTSDLKRRQEGVRIKHRYNGNSVKLYDKAYTTQGSVLRAEMTMAKPEDFKVYRRSEGDPESALEWRRLRKGVADLHRRAEVSSQANDRYLNALANTDTSARFGEVIAPLQKVASMKDRRVRAMRPFDPVDRLLLEAISRGEFLISGLRNKDLQPLLYPTPARSKREQQRRSSAVSRKLRLLRAHHLIRKVPRSHRYYLTPLGWQVTALIIAACDAPANLLIPKAA
jgi:hypothetical protein